MAHYFKKVEDNKVVYLMSVYERDSEDFIGYFPLIKPTTDKIELTDDMEEIELDEFLDLGTENNLFTAEQLTPPQPSSSI